MVSLFSIILFLLSDNKLVLTVCPENWSMFNSSCYKGFSSGDRILSYTEAQDNCRLSQTSAQLPSVHSLAEINFIVELGKRNGWFGPKKGVYLGGTIIEGKLIWTDGSPTDYTLWSDHESQNRIKAGGCIAVFANLLFQQTSCNFDEKNLQLNWIRAKHQNYSNSDQDFYICKFHLLASEKDRVYSISVPGDVLENIGIVILSFIITVIFIAFSIIFFLQYFTCNVNLDCYRRRLATEPYSISLSISEDALMERRK